MNDDAQHIQSRMESIRSNSKMQQMQFVDDSARMLDWKEHVRAMPVTALVASVVVGFTLLYKKTPTKVRVQVPVEPTQSNARSFASALPFSFGTKPPEPKKSANPILTTAASIITPILLSAGKQFILKNLHTILSDSNHERQSKSAVPDKVL